MEMVDSLPSSQVKQATLRNYAKQYNLRVFIETGTNTGDTVEQLRQDFDQVYSIELGRDLYEKAREKFRNVSNVELIHGDSAIELEKLLSRINQPALFWLDGHYSGGETARGSGDTPIREELQHIFSSKDLGHVVIIDDARDFSGTCSSYPTVEEVSNLIRLKRPDVDIVVDDDSIRITPKGKS